MLFNHLIKATALPTKLEYLSTTSVNFSSGSSVAYTGVNCYGGGFIVVVFQCDHGTSQGITDITIDNDSTSKVLTATYGSANTLGIGIAARQIPKGTSTLRFDVTFSGSVDVGRRMYSLYRVLNLKSAVKQFAVSSGNGTTSSTTSTNLSIPSSQRGSVGLAAISHNTAVSNLTPTNIIENAESSSGGNSKFAVGILDGVIPAGGTVGWSYPSAAGPSCIAAVAWR